MKKLLALLLAAGMVLSLCACGGTPESATTEEPGGPAQDEIWSAALTVDEFGDVTPDSDTAILAEFSGDFSNTATASSELTVQAFFRRNPSAPHYILELALLEYTTTPATYLSSDTIRLKTKINDTVSESNLVGIAPNGNLIAGIVDGDYYGDIYFNALYDGDPIKCVVYIGSSQYNFTLESGNFKAVCDSEGFSYAPGEMTTAEALVMFLEYQGKGYEVPHECLLNHSSDFERMDDAAIAAEIMNGTFGCIEFIGYTPINDLKFPKSIVWQFSSDEALVVADFGVDYSTTQAALDKGVNTIFRKYSPTPQNASTPLGLRTEEGQLVMHNTGNEKDYFYLCYRVADGIYLLNSAEDRPIYLLFRSDGVEEADILAATDRAIATIQG